MKRYIVFLLFFAFVFGIFNLNINFASAYDWGCTGGNLYSVTTGQPCYGGSQINYLNSSNDYGCSFGALYNTITGQPCYGAQSSFLNYQNQYPYQYQYSYQYQNQYPYQSYPYQTYPYQNQYPYQVPSTTIPTIYSVSPFYGAPSIIPSYPNYASGYYY